MLGTAAVFAVAFHTLTVSIHRRDDVWLTGEIDSLAEIAAKGSREELGQEFTQELAELRHRNLSPAADEAEDRHESAGFFALLDPHGRTLLSV